MRKFTNYYPPENIWTHISVTRTVDGQISIYANGKLLKYWSSSATVTNQCSQAITIGSGLNQNGGEVYPVHFFNGSIDEVTIYNRALSAEEIQANMHNRPDTDDPNLVGYWDFDEGDGQEAYDLSGKGNHGQLGSTPDIDDNDPNWVDSDAPVGICTLDGLVERNLNDILDIKLGILEDLDRALGKEAVLFDYVDEAFHEGAFDNLKKGDVAKAKQKIHSAIKQEEQAETAVDQSIDKLDDAMNTLGLE